MEVKTSPVFKTFNCVVKEANGDTGEVDLMIPMSTGSVDRDGQSVDPMAFKKRLKTFKAHPILLSSHNYGDLQKQIGEFTSIKVTEEGLFGKPKYYIGQGNPEADWGFFLASQGMASYSIGFIPFSYEDDEKGDGDKSPRRTYTDVELLEISHVVVPSNRDAAQSIRSVLTAKGIKPPADMEAMLKQVEAPIVMTPEKQAPLFIDVNKDPDVKEARAISQKELADELDYCLTLIGEVGLSDGTMVTAYKLADKINEKRVSGSDIPVAIKESEGPKPKPCDSIQELVGLIEIRRQYGLINNGGK